MVSPPEPIGQALEALEARRGELSAAQVAVRQAQRAVVEARQQDNSAIATARDSGKREPSRRHEQQAEQEADRATREVEVAQERLRRAGERLNEAVEAGHEEWREAVDGAWSEADRLALAALEEFVARWTERNELVVLRQHVRAVADPRTREGALARPPQAAGVGVVEPLRGANGDATPAQEVFAALAEHIRATSLERLLADERAQRGEHEQAQEAQAARDEATRQREAEELASAQHRVGPPGR